MSVPMTDSYTGNINTEKVINNDEEFMNKMTEIKSLLRDGTPLAELKSKEAELLRTKIVEVLRYVMLKLEEENEETQQTQEEPPSTSLPVDYGNNMSMSGGKKKGKGKGKAKKQKGGTSMELSRVTNTSGITSITKDPYDSIIKNPDIYIGLNAHNAFTAGTMKGFSSVSGMPQSDLNTMLPSYGTPK